MDTHSFQQLHDLPPDMAFRLLDSIAVILDIINNRTTPFDKRLDQFLKIILDYLGIEQGSIMLLEGRTKLVVRAASRRELLGLQQHIDEPSVAANVARTGKVECICDITEDSRFQPRNNSYKSKSLLSAPIMQGDKVLGVINVTDKQGGKDLLQDDITYLLNFSSLVLSLIMQEGMTSEIKRQRNTLKKRNKALRQQQGMQTDLTRMLIHDIKGPLSEVIANLDILSYTADEEQKIFLESAQLSCDRAVRMAANLGSVAKIEDGSLKLLRQNVDPAILVDEATINIMGLAKIRDITLQQECEPNLPILSIDKILIERVLQNLLTNSLGHAPQSTKITIGCHSHPSGVKVIFFVQDQGEGIRSEAKELIFEKYARLSNQQDSLVGTGLGLYFCRLAVEAHKGKINVDSTPGLGSRFYFSLPTQ